MNKNNEILNIICQNMHCCMHYFINNKIDFIHCVLSQLKAWFYIKKSIINEYYEVLKYKENSKYTLILNALSKNIKWKKNYLMFNDIIKLYN